MWLGEAGVHGIEQVLPGCHELFHPFPLQGIEHIIEINAGGGEGGHGGFRFRFRTGEGIAVHIICRQYRINGGFRHGVDRVRPGEFGDVQGGGVVRVLHTGGGPQGALHIGAGRQFRAVGQVFEESGVGEAGICHPGLALEGEGFLGADGGQALVDLGVEAGHEERGHRVDGGHVFAVGFRLVDAVDEGVDDFPVADHRENQGDVDADAFGQCCRHRGQGAGGWRGF